MYRTKKIILINFPLAEINISQIEYEKEYGFNPSFSLMALGSWLEFNGYDVELIDLFTDLLSVDDLCEKIAFASPVFVGCSIHTVNKNISLRIIKKIKERQPHIKIVVGGPHPTLCPEDFYDDESVDFVSVQEGESTLLELAEALVSDEKAIAFSQIDGLIYRIKENVYHNDSRKMITDMDLLPIVKREFFLVERYGNVFNMITGRGCPGRCIYCAANILSGTDYRSRSVENVFLEIILLKAIWGNSVKRICFVDDTFTADKERVMKFVKLLDMYMVDIKWRCQSRIDMIDYEMIDELKQHGCDEMLYGIESGNQLVLNKIGKNISLDEVWKIMRYTHEKNMNILCSFILGHYCDTKETMIDTYNMVKQVCVELGAEVAVYLNTPYPGTRQYVYRDRLGLKIVEENLDKYTNVYPIVETDNFTVDDQLDIWGKCYEFILRFKDMQSKRKTILSSLEID